MGTTYSIKAINDKVSYFNTNKLQDEIDSLLNDYNSHFSTYIVESEISEFNYNNTSDYITVSTQFYDLLLESKYIFQMTGGAFDITVGPLVELWGFGPKFRYNVIPDVDKVDSVLQFIGTDNLLLQHNKVKKAVSGIEIDFSAIAKGGGVDLVASYLLEQKIDRYMIEIGGELSVSGMNKENRKWKLGIRKPEQNKIDLIREIEITNIFLIF